MSHALQAFIGSSLKLKFCAELLICILQPLPTEYYKSGIEFSGDSWFRHMGLLMFLRSYIFVRILRDFRYVALSCVARTSQDLSSPQSSKLSFTVK